MMKQIFKILILFCGIIAMYNCEPDSEPIPDIKLVPIYAVRDTVPDDEILTINVYRDKDLMVKWFSQVEVEAYGTSDYADNSTADSFKVSLLAYEDSVYVEYDSLLNPIDSTNLEIVYNCSFEASKSDSVGIMDITTYYPGEDADTIESPTEYILMYNDKVYN